MNVEFMKKVEDVLLNGKIERAAPLGNNGEEKLEGYLLIIKNKDKQYRIMFHTLSNGEFTISMGE